MRIRRGLSSRHLPCGCLVGIYETYGEEIVTIVDAAADACADPAHFNGNIIPSARPTDTQTQTPHSPRR